MNAGEKGLAAVDKVLAERPRKDDAVLSEAMEQLCILRGQLIEARAHSGDAAAASKRLSQLNAVISVVAGTHFPLGETPWDQLETARTWLAGLVGQAG